jgi:hypothetical protein
MSISNLYITLKMNDVNRNEYIFLSPTSTISLMADSMMCTAAMLIIHNNWIWGNLMMKAICHEWQNSHHHHLIAVNIGIFLCVCIYIFSYHNYRIPSRSLFVFRTIRPEQSVITYLFNVYLLLVHLQMCSSGITNL